MSGLIGGLDRCGGGGRSGQGGRGFGGGDGDDARVEEALVLEVEAGSDEELGEFFGAVGAG